ncbi:MAG: hypothetical protein JWP61_874 [Friedmanniella sp.]|nr:hypothetical protein [Friedmanniella sp.]
MSEGHAAPPFGAPQFEAPEGYPAPGPAGGHPGPTPYGTSPYAPSPYGAPDPTPGGPTTAPSPYVGPRDLSEADLVRLPPPQADRAVAEPQRPGVVALAATLTVTASLQWVTALSLLWVTAAFGAGSLESNGTEGVLFHLLNRFSARMLDGLAIPLYLFPALAVVAGLLLLRRQAWTRVAHTVLGLASVAWAAVWLNGSWLWWVIVAGYVAFCCAVVWTRAATRWYAQGLPPRAW